MSAAPADRAVVAERRARLLAYLRAAPGWVPAYRIRQWAETHSYNDGLATRVGNLVSDDLAVLVGTHQVEREAVPGMTRPATGAPVYSYRVVRT
jgi:hypothetical protein